MKITLDSIDYDWFEWIDDDLYLQSKDQDLVFEFAAADMTQDAEGYLRENSLPLKHFTEDYWNETKDQFIADWLESEYQICKYVIKNLSTAKVLKHKKNKNMDQCRYRMNLKTTFSDMVKENFKHAINR